MKEPVILLLGPAYVGKTTFFNRFVQKFSIKHHLYPGTKVQVNTGYAKIGNQKYMVIDTPGIYNLVPTSENEIVVLNLILAYQPEKIIFITREENSEYNILMMIQLAELSIPFLVSFYRKNDFSLVSLKYDSNSFCGFFNTAIAYTTPVLNQGIQTVKHQLQKIAKPRWVGGYSNKIESLLSDFDNKFRSQLPERISSKFFGLMLLLSNQPVLDWLRKHLPEKVWEDIFLFYNRSYNLSYAFGIANRWKALTKSLLEEVLIPTTEYKPRTLVLLDKYSLTFIWDWVIMFGVLSVWFLLLNWVGTKFLVNILYNELFGKYLGPFLTYLFNLLFGQSFISALLVGQFGLFSIGLSYAFMIIFPTLWVFFFIYAYLDETGYLIRMAVSLNKLLNFLGINSYFLPHLLLSNSCKIAAVLNTRTLETKKERITAALLLLFAFPCISQFAIISNLLSIIPHQYVFIYFCLMFGQIFIILKLYGFLNRNETSSFVLKIPPLKVPVLSTVFQKTGMYLSWYIREIIPYILLSSLVLFFFDALHILPTLKSFLTPLVVNVLNLPDKFVETIIFGLFRKDFGAVSLYDLANNGLLNSIQVLVAVVFLSLSIPCLGFLGALYREKGLKITSWFFVGSTVYAFTMAALLNKILRI